MVEISSVDQLKDWYGRSPDSPVLGVFESFAFLAPALASEVRAAGLEAAGQLQELFIGARLGVVELFASLQEKTAASILRSFFGEPNLDLEGAVPAALKLKSTEAYAAREVRTSRLETSVLLENLAQAIAQLLEKCMLQLQLVEAKIDAKQKALGISAKLEVHQSVNQDKNVFSAYTNLRLKNLVTHRDALLKKVVTLVHLSREYAQPLGKAITRMSSDLLTVAQLDPSKAIPVGPIAQPAT